MRPWSVTHPQYSRAMRDARPPKGGFRVLGVTNFTAVHLTDFIVFVSVSSAKDWLHLVQLVASTAYQLQIPQVRLRGAVE